jgi:hypothetical protein
MSNGCGRRNTLIFPKILLQKGEKLVRRTKIETSWSTYLIIAGILVIAGCSNPTGSASDSGTIEIKGGPGATERDGTYIVTSIVTNNIDNVSSTLNFCLDSPDPESPLQVTWIRADPVANSIIRPNAFSNDQDTKTEPVGSAEWGIFSDTTLTKIGPFKTTGLSNTSDPTTGQLSNFSKELTLTFNIRGMEVMTGTTMCPQPQQ